MIKKIGILASGGNSPAMNNCIITIVKKCSSLNIESVLINEGFHGLLNENFTKPDVNFLSVFYDNGNVCIGTSRCPEFKEEKNQIKAYKILKKHKIDCLFVIGGNGSYHGGYALTKLGMHVICLPATIDNDINSTEKTIGFSTALNNIVTCIDSIKDSFDSHRGICLIEVMGRRFPDLAINAGIACGVEGIITSSNIMTADDIVKLANETEKNGHRSCLIVVTEKIYGRDGLPTLNEIVAEVQKRTNRVSRADVLGYIQRGGTTTSEDRIMGNLMGAFSVDLAQKDNKSYSVDFINGRIVGTNLEESINAPLKKEKIALLKDYFKYNKK